MPDIDQFFGRVIKHTRMASQPTESSLERQYECLMAAARHLTNDATYARKWNWLSIAAECDRKAEEYRQKAAALMNAGSLLQSTITEDQQTLRQA